MSLFVNSKTWNKVSIRNIQNYKIQAQKPSTETNVMVIDIDIIISIPTQVTDIVYLCNSRYIPP